MLTHSEANKEAVFNIGFASRTAQFSAGCCLVKYLSRPHVNFPPTLRPVGTNALLLFSLESWEKKYILSNIR